MPVGYFHVVFTVPAEIADIAWQNKAVVYDLLFRAAADTMLTIAADPKHLGARVGITAVLHTWGSALTHHPHVHMIVPGGGIALDGTRWISSRPAFLLPVRVLGALFRRLFLTRLLALFDAGKLAFFSTLAGLATRKVFLRCLSPIRKKRWVVYAKPPFAGPQAVLAYLSRYTHRVAISNRRLIAFDDASVTFRYKDYRRDGAERQQVMSLAHPPLSNPRPAARLPPYPALRSARQFDAQGGHGARPQAAGRRCSDRGAPIRRTVRSPSAMPVLRRAHDHHRNFRPLVSTARAASASIPGPETHAMIRHGSPCTTVALIVSWPMIQRMPIPELNRAQGTRARKTNVVCNPAPHEITLMAPAATLTDRQRSTTRTIPEPFCP